MSWTVHALAETLGLAYRGDGDRRLERVDALESAGAESLSFVSRASYLDRLEATGAGAVVLAPAHAEHAPCAVLLADNPYAAYARAAQLLHPAPQMAPGTDPTAQVDPAARIAASAHIGPQVVIGADTEIGADAVIEAGAYIGAAVTIGAATRIGPRVVIRGRCRIGSRSRIQPGAVIGADGFGYARDDNGWVRIPQMGGVVIGDDVEIGANTTIDRGTLEDTVVGDGVILDNQIQIGHNVGVGERTAMAGCVGVAGSAVIGRDCTIGGAAGILGHLEIADDVHITAKSLVRKSITLAGTYSSGTPLEPSAEWRRNAARFRQLDALTRRVDALEKNKP